VGAIECDPLHSLAIECFYRVDVVFHLNPVSPNILDGGCPHCAGNEG